MLVKGCLIALIVVAGIFILALGIGAWLYFQNVDLSREMTPVEVSPEAAQKLDARIENVSNTLQSSPAGSSITLEVSETEATSWIGNLITESESTVPVRDIRINFRDGLVKASGILNMDGEKTFLATARVEPAGDALKVDIQEFKVGHLPLPGAVVSQLISSFGPGINLSYIELPQDIRAAISSITLENGKAIIEMKAK